MEQSKEWHTDLLEINGHSYEILLSKCCEAMIFYEHQIDGDLMSGIPKCEICGEIQQTEQTKANLSELKTYQAKKPINKSELPDETEQRLLSLIYEIKTDIRKATNGNTDECYDFLANLLEISREAENPDGTTENLSIKEHTHRPYRIRLLFTYGGPNIYGYLKNGGVEIEAYWGGKSRVEFIEDTHLLNSVIYEVLEIDE